MNFDALKGNPAVTLDITLCVQITVRHISKNRFCHIFREKQSDSDCFTLQIKTVILRNFQNCIPSGRASCPTELTACSYTAVTAFLCLKSWETLDNSLGVFWENFEKLLLALSCLSLILSVRPSVRIEKLGSHRMDYFEIRYLRIFLIIR